MNNQEGNVSSHQMQAEIAELNGRIADMEDPRECFAMVRERIEAYRSSGRDVPEDLAQIEKRLHKECMFASQGR
jgi:hypothetical protein